MNIEEIRAHPRVCGENYTENAPVRSSAGSSPRVRGKRECSSLGRIRCGLIPACAGKTGRRRFKQGCGAAHPRVCGENKFVGVGGAAHDGSSPRVRGKLEGGFFHVAPVGLIPACAGKTTADPVSHIAPWAHPRVCGENHIVEIEIVRAAGSSPRVRGKPSISSDPLRHGRLIPACAGKTAGDYRRQGGARAHPRVCGENELIANGSKLSQGSSPRVRGKQTLQGLPGQIARLIPACAGKTGSADPADGCSRAHPRVCGENSIVTLVIESTKGSSPRVRGKPGRKHPKPHPGRLIPACAGKTFFGETFKKQLGAHPRVCGEN